ncbi:unnamed protein product [Aphanomyces euteiches]
MADSKEPKSPVRPFSHDMHQDIARVDGHVTETAAEVKETAREVKTDFSHIKVDITRSPRSGGESPTMKGKFLGKMETLKKLSPTKEDMVAGVNKLKNLWRYRSSTASDGDGDMDDGYSSSEDEEEGWEAVLNKPIEEILANHSQRKWKDAPDYLLRNLSIHTLVQLPITHRRKLYLIVTGPCLALLVTIANWVLAASIFFMYFLLVGFGSAVYAWAVLVGILPRPELRTYGAAFKLEYEALKLFLRLEWEACLDYRVRQPRIDELVSTDDKEHKKRILHQLVMTVLDNIRSDVDGSKRFKEVTGTISLGSVVVGATLYTLFVFFTFVKTQMEFQEMNTRFFDGLAIILPFLLAEELAVFLARVTLVIKWFSVFLHDNTVVQMFVDKEPDEASKSAFINDARTMCKRIGVGAWDMTGIASAMTAVWTIFFLYQSYYVDCKSSGIDPGPAGLADTMFWSMVLYSIVIIALCYLPFTQWFAGNSESDEKYLAMLKSCQTFMVMNRLSAVQHEISVAIRKEYARVRGVPVGQHVSHEEKRMLRTFRAGILKTFDKADFVSFFLYTICLTLVDFDSPDGENEFYRHHVKQLRLRGSYLHCGKLEIPIDKLQKVEIELFAAQSGVDPWEEDGDKKPKEKPQGAIVPSLFDFEVLDAPVGDSFVDKEVYELSQLLENPSVRDFAVYRNPYVDKVVLGLELKMMERNDKRKGITTNVLASVYLLAMTINGKYEIGHGPIFLRGAALEKKTLKMEGVDVIFEKVSGKILPRYVRRCCLATSHEKRLFDQADEYLKGLIPHGAPGGGNTESKHLVRTGSASHLSPPEYRTASASTFSPVLYRTGSGHLKADMTPQREPNESMQRRPSVRDAQRQGSDSALEPVHQRPSVRDLSSWSALPSNSV